MGDPVGSGKLDYRARPSDMGIWVYATLEAMKTTVEITDGLLEEAKRVARERDITLRELIECGLRKELRDRAEPKNPYVWEDLSYGDPTSKTWLKLPLNEDDWGPIREAAYEREPAE